MSRLLVEITCDDGTDKNTFKLAPFEESPDPGLWGMLAVDLLHHAANMLESMEVGDESGPLPRQALLDRMKELFDKEWANRTGEAKRVTHA